MSASISSINYCPAKSMSIQSIDECEIKKNIGIVVWEVLKNKILLWLWLLIRWVLLEKFQIVYVFYEGKIFEQGPPEQLFDNPQNERTKQFLQAALDANYKNI